MRPTSPLFSMVQLNDTHVRSGLAPDNSRDKLAALIRAILADFAPALPDLVLLAGDLVHEPLAESFAAFSALLGPLGAVPQLTVPGNHDIDVLATPPQTQLFTGQVSAGRLNYLFFFRGVLFILLNNADGDVQSTPAQERRNEWLATQLTRYAEVPKLVVCHVPLTPMRDPEPLAASFNFTTWMDQDPAQKLLNLLIPYRDSTIAVLSGHLHLTAHVEREGLHFIVPTGSVSWPHDCARLTFYEDRLAVRMIQPLPPPEPGAYGQFPFANGIHDRASRGQVFCDGAHPDLESYIMGLPAERTFTIALDGARRPRPDLMAEGVRPGEP